MKIEATMLKLTIEPTDLLTEVDGVPVRLWRGTTPQGHPVQVFVRNLASNVPAAQAELARVLREVEEPRELRRVSLRQIL